MNDRLANLKRQQNTHTKERDYGNSEKVRRDERREESGFEHLTTVHLH